MGTDGSGLIGITHSGDILSPLLPYASLSGVMAATLGHVSQVSHANPHGLALSDLGGVSIGQEQADIANVLASAENFTNVAIAALNFGSSFSGSGFQRLPSGLIIQWVTGNQDNTDLTVTQGGNWPIPFPNLILGAFVSTNWFSNSGSTDSDLVMYQLSSKSNSGWTTRRGRGGQYSQNELTSPTLFAIGF
jgi:hypothetical protein